MSTLIEVKSGAPIPEKVTGRYKHGDVVDPTQVAAATLRHLALERGGKLGKGKATANAQVAVDEIKRRKDKREAKAAEAAALAAQA